LEENVAFTFRKKNKSSRNQYEAYSKQNKLLLLSDPEDGGKMFLQYASGFSMDYIIILQKRYVFKY
jgi:hypothetical protein